MSKLPRRAFLKYPLAASVLAFLPQDRVLGIGMEAVARRALPAGEEIVGSVAPATLGWSMPSEQARHERCWMAFPATAEIWRRQLPDVRADIAKLARTIARFEPVGMIVDPSPGQAAEARRLCGSSVTFVSLPVDDMWFRDSGPIFLTNGRGGIAGSTFNFNGWGNKQMHGKDGKIAERLLAHLGVKSFRAPFVTEGGAVMNDGDGTLMVTQPSIDNKNRNPGKTRAQLTDGLRGWLGMKKILWMPDRHPDYWTDGHVDGVARFVQPGHVLVDQHIPEVAQFLRAATDAQGRRISVVEVPPPPIHQVHPGHRNSFCRCYLNFYFANGAVIMPKFGDAQADDRASGIVRAAYPKRQVVQIELNAIAAGGGLIHCVTQQQPAV